MPKKPTYEELKNRIQELENIENSLKRAGEDLLESEGRCRAVVEDMPELICSFLPGGEITFVNKGYCEYFGQTFEELVGTNFQSLIPESEKKFVMDNISELKVESPTQSHEHKVIAPNGNIRWQSWTNRALFDDQGNTVEYLSIGTDITERKKVEEELRKSEKRYRQLVEAMNEGVGVADQDYNFTYVNDKFCEMLGYSPDEIIDHPLIEFVHDDFKGLMKDQMAQRKKGEETRFELAWKTKDGDTVYTLASPKSLHDENGHFNGSMGVLTDITDRIKAEEALREKDTKLEQQAKHLIEVNTALKILLEQREKEKTKIKERLLADIKKLVYPYIEKLENIRLNQEAQTFVNIIKSNLDDLISPFATTLSSKYYSLTPSEIQIADLIKHGKTSKEIASILNVSSKAISFHRGNLRKKLGLLNKKINLRTYLQTFPH